MERDVVDNRSSNCSTPRGNGELVDFDELEKMEAERGVLHSREKDPFQCLHEVGLGDKVQVMRDVTAMLMACRGAGIDTTNDEQRMASVGKAVTVLEKDASDNTVKCRVPTVGIIWFAVTALMPFGLNSEVLTVQECHIDKQSQNISGDTSSKIDQTQWTEWLLHMAGLAQSNALEEENLGDKNSEKSKLEMEFVKMELEIEAGLERRLWAKCQEGVLGSKITIKTAVSMGQRQEEKQTFIADAINSAVKQIHKLLVHNKCIANINSERLELIIILFATLMSVALPCQYIHKAIAHCEWLVSLFQEPRKGLCALACDMFNGATMQSEAILIYRKMDSKFKEVVDVLRKFLDCMVIGSPTDQECTDAVYGELTQAVCSSTSSWPEWLVRRQVLLKERSLRDYYVIRTSQLTITRLLHDLRSNFQSEKFQTKYKELRRQAQPGNEVHIQMVEWTFEVQKKVLPMYGFEASPKGMWSMRGETGFHADADGPSLSGQGDKIVAKLRRDIHVCLDMDATRTLKLPKFHTVGDSHSKFGWPPCVIQHWQGPLLCYNVDRVDLRNMTPPIQEGDAICLCFGEIDCRCHVYKHCNEETSYQEVIDGIIAKYFEHLRIQVRLLPQGVKIFVYNVPPPTRRCDAEENPQFPHLGEDEERKAYVLYFNKRLKAECRRLGFRFFDVYDHYADAEGFLAVDYSDGNVHISDGCWIEEVIQGLRLKPSWTSEIQLGA